MAEIHPRENRSWRKSRLAARVLIRQEAGRMTKRDHLLAEKLGADMEVTNRLIQQALYYLGVGPRKHAFDQKLVETGH
jgi:hypothetical protein